MTLMAQPSSHTATMATVMPTGRWPTVSPNSSPISFDQAYSSCEPTVATMPPIKKGRRLPKRLSHLVVVGRGKGVRKERHGHCKRERAHFLQLQKKKFSGNMKVVSHSLSLTHSLALTHLSEKLPTMGCTRNPVTAPAAHVQVVNVLGTPRLRMYEVWVANSVWRAQVRGLVSATHNMCTGTCTPRKLNAKPWQCDGDQRPQRQLWLLSQQRRCQPLLVISITAKGSTTAHCNRSAAAAQCRACAGLVVVHKGGGFATQFSSNQNY